MTRLNPKRSRVGIHPLRGLASRIAVLATLIFFFGAVSTALAGPPYTSVKSSHIVPTRHGDLYVEVTRPLDSGQMVPGPAIITYSPYSVLGRGGYWRRQPRLREVFADVVGTGNSGGCYDYGGKREK